MRPADFIILLFLSSIINGSEWSNSATFSFANKAGNTNINSFTGNVTSSNKGDFTLFGKLLTDSEFSFTVDHARSTQNDTSQLEHNGAISVVFDYHANKIFSPFVFTGWEYDSLAGVDNRTNLGMGAKYRFTNYSSISAALLIESQTYTGDSAELLSRISVRPKYKRSFDNGSIFDWIIFYQPSTSDWYDYLIKSELNTSLQTSVQWLAFTCTAVYDYNSRPPADVKHADLDLSIGITISF
ncbi:uncharacterized protein METZ01_LOCUS105830 [marine metagenome]|jgi:hypothetical protein|uniref:DUF481 domain-containing protein n=1 Tax=marine metagenome TaxID=408172 RepID=A0A381WKD3_9ZZZZ|tara:strand:+ start:1045 stop:1767 length:723 start_codon:yes stop_codon:yes gene_type:complete